MVYELGQLLDREMIKETKARYFRFMDTKQWERWRTVFTDDAKFESSKVWDSPESFVHDVSTSLSTARTVHHGHMPEIAFTDPDTARVIWAMYDFVEQREVTNDWRGIVGYGHYEEEYRRVGDEWKISFLRLTRLRVDPLMGEHAPTSPITRVHSPTWLTGAP
jgi:SnoaL-like domain